MENPKIIKMNMIQAEFGVIPSIVKKENREEYIKSLVASQEEGNPNSFIEFMLKHHIANLEKTITEYNHSIENDTLNLENDTLNDTLNLSEKETLILNLIKADNHITITDLIDKSGFSRPTWAEAPLCDYLPILCSNVHPDKLEFNQLIIL